MAKCKDCIHKNICYPIEYYGNYSCSDEACDKFLATPVVHGRWIINSDGYYPQCSECMNEPQGRIMTDFCPNCGAKMDDKK